MHETILDIRNIDTWYSQTRILQDVSMTVGKGEIVGVVGESGSGKSTTIYSALGVLGKNGYVSQGEILYQGKNLLELKKKERQSLCGRHLSLIAQNPMESFHPIKKIKKELYELARAHKGVSPKEAEEAMLHFMAKMKLDGPEVLQKYAYELSGGMCQRASIAMAMALRPEVLFADEPTSALDVTVQKQVVEELMKIRDENDTSILIVSHNMGVISYMSDRIYVMLAGMVVENGTREQIIHNPMHPYTQNLIHVIPRVNKPAPRDVRPTEYNRAANACPYSKICQRATEQCRTQTPTLKQCDDGRQVRCHQV